jgi:uncharacterized protein YjeT (DUF2065 family)
MSDELWSALALVLILEGILPFVAPNMWRATFLRLTQLTDGQLRFVGLLAICIGMLALFGERFIF